MRQHSEAREGVEAAGQVGGAHAPLAPGAARVLALQRQAGNRAVAAALARGMPRVLAREGGATATATDAPATAPAATPAPSCRLTQTTVPPQPGDWTDDEALQQTYNLPPEVQASGGKLRTDCKRREFMRWAREWFGTYRAAHEWFMHITPAAGVPGSPLVHDSAAARLRLVAQELGATMPSTTTAFAFRDDFQCKHPGMGSMHTLGLALDYDASRMPQIGTDQSHGNERALLIELMSTNGPANAQILDYARRRDAIQRMGDRSAAAATAAASAPAGTTPAPVAVTAGDVNAQTVITGITSEFERLTQASRDFGTILGAGRADFLELRTQYFEAATPAAREEIVTRAQPILRPIFDAITRAEGAGDVAPQRARLLTSLRGLLQTAPFLFGSARRPAAPRAPRVRRGEPPPPPTPAPRPTTAHVVSAPSLAQLLEAGWFNPGTTGRRYDLNFALAMARHGFEGGYVWGGQTQDSMHFELVVDRPYTPPRATQPDPLCPTPAERRRAAAAGRPH